MYYSGIISNIISSKGSILPFLGKLSAVFIILIYILKSLKLGKLLKQNSIKATFYTPLTNWANESLTLDEIEKLSNDFEIFLKSISAMFEKNGQNTVIFLNKK